MDVQEILAQIDHAVTEIDLVLHQWQEDLDMMSFISSNAQFAMWTDEVPPRVVTSRNISLLPLQGIKDVRVMHFTEDGWTKVGTARINEDGNFVTKIDRDIPGLTDVNMNFSIDALGSLKPVILPGWPKSEPLKIRGLEEAIEKAEASNQRRLAMFEKDKPTWDIDNNIPADDPRSPWHEGTIENHPFFKKEN